MKVSRKLLTRLEGEAELKLFWQGEKIKDAYISVPNYRGFERILMGKPVMDALVINPRICGICGHAHLRATVEAIEDSLKRAGYEVTITEKARLFRDITLSLEIIQNHLRWFYLYLMPDVVKLKPSLRERFAPLKGSGWQEGVRASNYATKALATLAGQWPHSSYMVPGGVTCDPTEADINKVEALVERVVDFFEEKLAGIEIQSYMSMSGAKLIREVKGDILSFFEACFEHGLDSVGRSYGRFLTGGTIDPCVVPGTKSKRICKFHPEKVYELEGYSFFSKNGRGYTWAKAARYGGFPCETGPLARQLIAKNPRVVSLYKKYGDSVLVRVFARLDEILTLSLSVLDKLRSVDLSQRSCIAPPKEVKSVSGEGIGVVEAARGTLIHKISVSRGKIKFYDVITPTVWNLGPRDDVYLGVAEKAMIGLDSELKAYTVLRSFDVCSVCTSH